MNQFQNSRAMSVTNYQPSRLADFPDDDQPQRENRIVLFSQRKKRQVKTFERAEDGTVRSLGYTSAFKGRPNEYVVGDVIELYEFLRWAEAYPKSTVLRGHPLLTGKSMRRLFRAKEDCAATFEDTPRLWIAIDIDDLEMPPGLTYGCPADLAEYAVSRLPHHHFWDVSYVWQLSSSAGVTTSSVIKLHLWFWLDQACTSADLRGWAKSLNGLVDSALYNPVQPHITARPVFVDMEDPFPVRTGLVLRQHSAVRGADLLRPPPPPPKVKQLPGRGRHAAGRQRQTTDKNSAFVADGNPFAGWPPILRDMQREQHFHRHIWRLLLSYVGRGGTSHDEVKAALRREVPDQNTSNRGDVNERYLSDTYLDEQIKNAIGFTKSNNGN